MDTKLIEASYRFQPKSTRNTTQNTAVKDKDFKRIIFSSLKKRKNIKFLTHLEFYQSGKNKMVASSFLHHICGVIQTSAPQIHHKHFMIAVPKPMQSTTAPGQDMVTSPMAMMHQAGASGSRWVPPCPDSCQPQPVCVHRW